MSMNKFAVAVSLTFSFVATANAANTTIKLQSVDQGYYLGATKSLNPLSSAISIQQDSVNSDRNFFVFDFTALNMANVVSAEFYAKNSWNSSSENHIEYSLFDVTTPVSALKAGDNGQSNIYTDLGSGGSYASIEINNPSRYDNLVISFNEAGIKALQASSSLFAIGGAFTSKTNGVSWLFADNENLNAPFSYGLRLTFSETVTAVPEADSFAMLLAGLSVVALATRRRTGK